MQQPPGFRSHVLPLARVGLGRAAIEQYLGFIGIPIAQHGLRAEQFGHLGFIFVKLVRREGRGSADNERGPRFVNEDRVHFVHDRKEMAAFDLCFGAGCHAIVAQVIEAELSVRPIRNVALVLLAAYRGRLVVLDNPHRQPQEFVDFPHPLGIPGGKVIVHGDKVDVVTGQRIQVERHGRDEGLAFAGGHFRNVAAMQHHPANQLHIKRHHLPPIRISPDRPFAATETPASILHRGKRFR